MSTDPLLSSLKWITDAVAQQDLGVAALNAYYIHNGHIHATDGRMTVGTPFPFDGPSVLVPAELFERVLTNRPGGSFTWEHEADRLVLHRGRFRGRIKKLPLEMWVQHTDLPMGLDTVSGAMVDAMAALLPFISENATKPWATCMLLSGDYAYASNNVAVARAPWDAPTNGDYMLPRWVVEFVVHRRDGLAAWFPGPQTVTFLWEDGSWMRSSLILDQFPPVERVMETYYTNQTIDTPLTPEWVAAVRRVGKTTGDPVVRLRADEVRSAAGESLSVEDGVETPVPNSLEETVWDLRYLDPVLDAATHWNPTTYPKPAPWRGPLLEGIITGRRD